MKPGLLTLLLALPIIAKAEQKDKHKKAIEKYVPLSEYEVIEPDAPEESKLKQLPEDAEDHKP